MRSLPSPVGYPDYLDGPDRGEYGFLPFALAAVPLWGWIAAGATAAAGTAAGTYVWGRSTGAEEAAQKAAAAQAAAAPAPGTYYPIAPAAPGLPADPSLMQPDAQPWYKDPRYLLGGALVLGALVFAYRASRPSRVTVVEE